MPPVNNFNTANEILPSSLAEEYDLTEEYLKNYPEDAVKVLSFIQSSESALQEVRELRQDLKEHSKGMERLREGSEILLTQQSEIIKSMEESGQMLQNISKTSSDLKAITGRAANVVQRVFNPMKNGLQNGFYFLTGHRAPAAVLPGENPLAIECTPENTTSITEPANQSSFDGKKNAQVYSIFV